MEPPPPPLYKSPLDSAKDPVLEIEVPTSGDPPPWAVSPSRKTAAGHGKSNSALGVVVAQLSKGEGDLFDCVQRSGCGAGYVECAKCSKKFSDIDLCEGRQEVKVLPCFHYVCAPCLKHTLAECIGDGLECPVCSHSQEKKALHQYLPHFEMHSKIDSAKIAQSDFICEECDSNSQAVRYCEDCVMNLCSDCVRHHQRAKATVYHTLVRLWETDTGKALADVHRAQYCAIHRNARHELFCEDCNVLICNQCATDTHQNHSYKLPSAALIERTRGEIQQVVESLSRKLLEGQKLLGFITLSCASMDRLAAKTRSDLGSVTEKLLAATELRCTELRGRLKEGCLDRRKSLEREKNMCSTALVDIWRAIDFLEKVMSRGTDVEVLKASGHVFNQQSQLQLQQWRDLAQADRSHLWIKGDVSAGWQCPQEANTLLREIATFGNIQVQPHLPPEQHISSVGSLMIDQ